MSTHCIVPPAGDSMAGLTSESAALCGMTIEEMDGEDNTWMDYGDPLFPITCETCLSVLPPPDRSPTEVELWLTR